MIRHFLVLLVCLATVPSPFALAGDDSKPATDAQALADVRLADGFYAQGKYDDAVAKYQAALKGTANLEAAQAGLAMALLRSGNSDAALHTVLAALTSHPDSARLMAVMGRVKFRRGEMGEAEQAFQAALQIDPKNAQAYLGLARLYHSLSLYAHYYAALKRAHDLDPSSPEVQLLWLQTLPRAQRLPALQAYFAGPHPQSSSLQHYQEYLEKTKNDPPHSCKLVNESDHADIKLEYVHSINQQWGMGTLGPMMNSSATHIEGVGLDVKMNDHPSLLLLDSGASGITIFRKAASRAGLRRVSDIQYSGIGDQGEQTGYLAIADRVKIGPLEFHDCVVTVSDRNVLSDNDAVGLVGADVFASYLIDLDVQQKMIRLSPLPKRPDDDKTAIRLNTQEDDNEDTSAEQADATAKGSQGYHPKDRYIAPDMKNWTQVFRFGHMLLVPTRLNGASPTLFVMDTGAYSTMLSTRAAQSSGKVGISNLTVQGANGRVGDVYRSEKVDLAFSRFHQQNVNAVAIDLSGISDSMGTEISGLLGMNLLSMLEMKIDYRDGLVDFVYRDNRGVTH